MISLNPLVDLSGLRRKPGIAEMQSLLELLPNPCILVEKRTQRIRLANTPANELTAFTRAELSNMPLTALIAEFDEHAFWELSSGQANAIPLTLRKRNGTKVEVQATRLDLAPQAKWVIVSFEEEHRIQKRQAQQQRRTEILSSMQVISQALTQPDLDPALHQVMQAGKQITGADVISIYLQDLPEQSQNFELVLSANLGADGVLPERLPGQEMMLLRSVQHWTPGKRPSTALHRAARAANLGFLASAPLGQTDAVIGFVAIAGKSTPDPASAQSQIQILANVITALIQYHAHKSNLENSLEEHLRAHVVDKTGVDAASEGIIVLTPMLSISRLNPAAEAMLGYADHEARSHPVGDILIGTGEITPALHAALQGVATQKQNNIHLYRRSGQPFLAQVSVIPAITQGMLEGIVILIHDLSEQEQIQTQAQQLEQRALLGEVTSIFAHEVRNPINNISTGLQLMAYNLPEDDPQQQNIARLQHDCERLNDLMRSVLAFSRPAEYVMEAVDLNQLISRLLDRMNPLMVQSNVQQFLKAEPTLPLVSGNPRALEQVFTNLITNAIEAMGDKGGTLAVKLQKIEGLGGHDYLEVHVADNGPGIPKELQERLFQPFFTTKPDGTGLGLAITKRILTAHKGNIQVTSYPGATVFHVQIPALENP
jgi:PAS domain S-box-containing protein